MNDSPQRDLTISKPVASSIVVGIGASAGGLAALKAFFAHVRPDSNLAFVVVVHLSPEHESHLADLLQPHVPFPVEQVTHTTALEPNHVYVIPPNANLSAIDTHLRLSKLEEKRRERAPIDYFFRTLAATYDGHSIGVILTGTGSDGTQGVRDIKAKGGIIIVQDPNEAEYDGMPQSAIATGLADLILPLAEIPEAVIRYSGTQPRIRVPEDNEDLDTNERNLLQKVFAQLRVRTERDFSRYKYSTILRRITRRMQLNYVEDLPAYIAKLQEQPSEVHALADDLLITVTSFFRDPEVFESLEREAIPRLFDSKGPEEALRVWSVGCATGEEAYSLAILFVEEALRRDVEPRIQIFASDLHARSLDKAREGFYPGDIQVDVSEERLKRFFIAENGGYRIKKEIRDLVVFAPHNLLGDPPFSRLDLISCRNLLIYLQREVQRDVIELFHYALKPSGTLLLGSAETIESSDLFRTEDKKRCLYRRRDVPVPEPRLPVFPSAWRRLPFDRIPSNAQPTQPDAYRELHQRMLARYAPSSILISADNKLVHLSERAGRFVLHPGGELTTNVFKLIREELRIELRSALQAVRNNTENYDSLPIPVRFEDDIRPVIMHLRPALKSDEEGFVLVIFEEGAKEALLGTSVQRLDAAGDNGSRLLELEVELTSSRQRLQGLVEEYETSQEEMRASNEEMQSANEELRSTLEELETSKEELQSINEELQTVNQENRHKVEELAELSGDLQNFLAATDIATLFLDRSLRIMRFTPKVGSLFNVRVTDRSRPISDLTHRLGYSELQSDAQSVLDRLVPIEREVRDEAGNWYLTRVLPYRSSEDRIEGVVITFVDITRRIEAERAVRDSENRYRLLIESAQEYAIFMLEADGRIATWNSGAERIFGFSEREILGSPVSVLFTEEDCAAGIPAAEVERTSREGRTATDGWLVRKDGERFWASGATEVLQTGNGHLNGFIRVLRDNSERKEAEERLSRHEQTLSDANNALMRANDDLTQFAFAASHDLREPLRMVNTYSQLLIAASREHNLKDAELAVGFIDEGIKRMDHLLSDLLAYTQLDQGEKDESHQVDLNQVFEIVRSTLRNKIEENEAIVTCDFLPTVRGREMHFIQLFQNLIDNSIKYRRDEAPRIHISAEQIGAEWRVAVADNGVGIDQPFHEIVFGVFKRLQNKRISGTGIGLAICRRVVERSGGRIWVESTGDHGSTFYFTLPA